MIRSVNIQNDPNEMLLPEVSEMQDLSKNIAVAVAKKAIAERIGRIGPEKDIEKVVNPTSGSLFICPINECIFLRDHGKTIKAS